MTRAGRARGCSSAARADPTNKHPETHDILPGSDWNQGVRVGDDGQFLIEGLVPGLKYSANCPDRVRGFRRPVRRCDRRARARRRTWATSRSSLPRTRRNDLEPLSNRSRPGSTAWARYEPTSEAPWDLRRVVHLHRRAGFAATWAEIKRDLKDGPEASIERVLTGTSRIGRLPRISSRPRTSSPTRPWPRGTSTGSRRGGSSGCSARPIRWASD